MAGAAESRIGDQQLRALERANRVRLARAALKRGIARGDVASADIILDSPWETASMPLGELLASQRRWGATRCRTFLAGLQLSENKQIGTLTPRQRRALADALSARAAPPAREPRREPALAGT